VDAAVEELHRRGGARIDAIHLKVGLLSGIVPAALRSAFEMAREEEPVVATAELVIEEIPVATYCPACDVERLISAVRPVGH
jgi:hydrogenase nickel incorporation protein HypA/HybF